MSGLESITIPASVISIGRQAFSNCKALRQVTIENGLQTLGDEAFRSCDVLERIDVPSSVTELGFDVFGNCPNLVLYGEADSAVESYASDYGLKFETK